jgi:tRNA(fMet)-specific endonuclease VapC
MLDTDCCVYLLNHSNPKLKERILEHKATDFCVSIISAFELSYGLELSTKREENRRRLHHFLREFPSLPLDDDTIQAYATVRAELVRKGQMIGLMDLLIATHALSLELTVITNNVREFSRVRGLRCENWTA